MCRIECPEGRRDDGGSGWGWGWLAHMCVLCVASIDTRGGRQFTHRSKHPQLHTHITNEQGHKGLVKPFKPGPPGIKLKGGDLEKLRKGEAVKQQLSAGSGGRGLVIQVGACVPCFVLS